MYISGFNKDNSNFIWTCHLIMSWMDKWHLDPSSIYKLHTIFYDFALGKIICIIIRLFTHDPHPSKNTLDTSQSQRSKHLPGHMFDPILKLRPRAAWFKFDPHVPAPLFFLSGSLTSSSSLLYFGASAPSQGFSPFVLFCFVIGWLLGQPDILFGILTNFI